MTTKESASLAKTYVMLTLALTGALWWAQFAAVNLFGARPVSITLPGFQSTAYASDPDAPKHRR